MLPISRLDWFRAVSSFCVWIHFNGILCISLCEWNMNAEAEKLCEVIEWIESRLAGECFWWLRHDDVTWVIVDVRWSILEDEDKWVKFYWLFYYSRRKSEGLNLNKAIGRCKNVGRSFKNFWWVSRQSWQHEGKKLTRTSLGVNRKGNLIEHLTVWALVLENTQAQLDQELIDSSLLITTSFITTSVILNTSKSSLKLSKPNHLPLALSTMLALSGLPHTPFTYWIKSFKSSTRAFSGEVKAFMQPHFAWRLWFT